MSKSSGKARKSARRRKKRSGPPQIKPTQPASDRTIYAGLLLIGLFFVLLAGLVAGGEGGRWWEFFVLYVIVLAWFVNLCTFMAYRGVHMANWKQAMARLPLRFAGYGTKTGKPLDAAHGKPNARTAMIICMLISVVVIVVLLLLRPVDLGFAEWSLRPW
jgi:hypothetical protein